MKIKCPNHNDSTPSLHCYTDFAFCFVCSFRCRTEEVLNGQEIQKLEKEPENIEEKLKYIEQLPWGTQRGLLLKTEATKGYYILWPDSSFYKLRRFDDRPRYIGPKGHRAPLFKYETKGAVSLVVVEGELNAVSLGLLRKEDELVGRTIASPGSATELSRHLGYYLQFKEITIIVDKDIPGIAHGLKLKEQLLKHKKKVHLVAFEKDFNQMLQDGGVEEIKTAWKRAGL